MEPAKIFDTIVSKPLWYNKIFNTQIVSKWLKEMGFGFGHWGREKFSPEMLSAIIGILRQIVKKNGHNLYKKCDGVYDFECIDSEECKKLTEEEQEEYSDLYDKTCPCVTNSCSCEINLKKDIKYYVTVDNNLVPKKLKNRLVKCIEKLENREFKDWHPWSDKQVLDLIHPSLYCYVDGVSSINNDKETKALIKTFRKDTERKYQWLPTEFNVGKNVKITSYINNLCRYRHSNMYNVVGEIFKKFVPMFEDVLGVPLTRELQVIVKAANIILTPDKPIYEGGSWHVEGMSYENIIATGLYYYDIDNITKSELSFRRCYFHENINYSQNEFESVKNHYGVEDGDEMNINLGAIEAIEGRCVVFPNYLQHHVEKFELKNKKKSGHRKILVFFLVNPFKRVLSTKHVPIQQKEIMENKLLLGTNLSSHLPQELVSMVASKMNKFISLEDAVKYREELMKERKYKYNEINKEFYERKISLCEH